VKIQQSKKSDDNISRVLELLEEIEELERKFEKNQDSYTKKENEKIPTPKRWQDNVIQNKIL